MTKLLTPAETAERLRVSQGTLANWRVQGRNLEFIKVHNGRGGIRYEEPVVNRLIANGRRKSTSEVPAE